MEFGLKGRHVAILAAEGVDAAHVEGPRAALVGAGVDAAVLAAQADQIPSAAGGLIHVDRVLAVCRAGDFDALVIPGGLASAEALSRDERARQLVREFMAADKPVAALGEGVRLLIAAEAVAGRVVAAVGELADAVSRAGGEPVSAALHVDEQLITAGERSDIGELNATILREFASLVDEARVDELSEQSFPASDPPPGPLAVGGEGASSAHHADAGPMVEPDARG